LAVDRAHRRIYVSCENSQLAALDSDKGDLLATIELPDSARDLAFDPNRNLIFALNPGGALTVVRVDSPTGLKVVQSLPTQAGARTLALDAVSGKLYLATAKFGLRTGETSEELMFRPTPVPGSFVVLVVGD
jgi:DNA-binding beta-propeller fold protein YncE